MGEKIRNQWFKVFITNGNGIIKKYVHIIAVHATKRILIFGKISFFVDINKLKSDKTIVSQKTIFITVFTDYFTLRVIEITIVCNQTTFMVLL